MTERVAPAARSDAPPRLPEEARPPADTAVPMSGVRAGADAAPSVRSAAPALIITPTSMPTTRAPAERAEIAASAGERRAGDTSPGEVIQEGGADEDVAALWERVCAFHDVSVVGGGLLADVQPIAIEGGRLRMVRVPGASSSLSILCSRAERIGTLIADAVGRRFRVEILEDPALRGAGNPADPVGPSEAGPIPSSRADGSRAEASVRALPAVRTAIEVFGAVVTDVSEADGPGAGAMMAGNRS